MKKRIITVLITIFTVIPLVLITPKAASSTTSTTTVTSYGQYFYTYGCSDSGFDLPIIGRVAWNSGSYITFTYEFLREYDGFINFTLKSNKAFAWQNCYFTVEGGVFTSQPNMTNSSNTKTFQIQFQNSSGFTLTIAKQEAFTLVSDSTFGTNTSITLGTYNFNTVPDVPDTLDHISDRFDFYIPGMSTSLSNIDSDLDNINQNIQALSPYIDQLEGYVDGLENYLNTLVNISHYNIDSNAYPMYFLGALDGYIDTSYNWVNTVYGIAPTLHITSQRTTYNQSFNVEIQPQQSLYMIYYSNYPSNLFYYLTSGGTRLDGTVTTLQSINGFRLFLVEFKNTVSSNSIYPSLCNTFPTTRNNSFIPLYMGYHIPADLADRYNLEIDNTYTRLLQSINNGIGALNDDYDTSAYDNYEQTLDGLNDGLRGRFDNVDNNMQTNVDTLFTPSGTAGSDGSVFEKFHFNAVNSFMSGFINRIFTSFPAFKYILIFALLLLVIGVMI